MSNDSQDCALNTQMEIISGNVSHIRNGFLKKEMRNSLFKLSISLLMYFCVNELYFETCRTTRLFNFLYICFNKTKRKRCLLLLLLHHCLLIFILLIISFL